MALTRKRQALNRHLWALVRQLPGREETLRDLVAGLHREDGTCEDLAGTTDYTSTRRLSDGQFARLVDLVAERAHWPNRSPRVHDGSVKYMAKPREHSYIRWLATKLDWSEDALREFIARQTKSKGVRWHSQANAVIKGLERMLTTRGWTIHTHKGRKVWLPPDEENT